MTINNFQSFSPTLFYYRYKEYFISIGAIAIGLLLLVFFVMPTSQEYFAQKEEERILAEKNDILSSNLKLITSMNDSALNHQFLLTSQAIISEKDYSSVMNSISKASQRSGALLGDFSFAVGDLSTRSPVLVSNSSFNIDIPVIGSLVTIERFIDALSSQSPLVVIVGVDINLGSATVHTTFPYKQFSLKAFSSLTPLKDFTAEDKRVLSVFETWDTSSLVAPIASSSAE